MNKVDWDKFVEIYNLVSDEVDSLKDIAKLIVRKGSDASPVIKGSKELLVRAKKSKMRPKFKNGLHVAAAVEDALVRKAESRKLTKPLKASEIPDDEQMVA